MNSFKYPELKVNNLRIKQVLYVKDLLQKKTGFGNITIIRLNMEEGSGNIICIHKPYCHSCLSDNPLNYIHMRFLLTVQYQSPVRPENE